MADNTNSIDIVLQDKVDAGIAPKLVAIRGAAMGAGAAVGALRAEMDRLKSLGDLSASLDTAGRSMAAASASTNTFTSAVKAQSSAAASATVIQTEANAATRGAVSANVSAAASLGLLEGRTLSMNRAAANFLTKILGLGSLMQTAFYAVGAIALVSVLYQGVEAFDKWYNKAKDAASLIGTAFDEVISPLRKSNDELALTNDKLDQTIAKLEHKPTSNGAMLALDEARLAADRLDDSLERVAKDLDSILNKNRIGSIASLATGQATTRDTSDFVKRQFDQLNSIREQATKRLDAASANNDPKAAQAATVAAYADERKAIQGTVDALNARYNILSKINSANAPRTADGRFDVSAQALAKAGVSSLADFKDETANLTILGKSVQLAQQDLRGLDETMANIAKNATVDRLRDQTSQLRDETKQAATEWKALEAAYITFQDSITQTGKKPTALQDLGFLQDQESTINPLNRDKLAAKEQPLKNSIAGEQFSADTIAKLSDQAANMTKYGTALKEATELDRIFQEAQQKGIVQSDAAIATETSLVGYINQYKALQTEETTIQKQAIDVESKYALALQASAVVMADHPALADAISRDLNRLKIAHDDAIDPLLEFNRGIGESRSLLGQYGDDLTVSSQVQKLADELRSKGVGDYHLQAEAQRESIAMQVQEQNQQSVNNALYEQTTGAIEKLVEQKRALISATNDQLSSEAKSSALVKNANDINGQGLATGQRGGPGAIIGGALISYASNFTTISKGIQDTLKGTFATLADGFADSIGRAIVYAKNLGSALKDVARSAISELISGLVKLGIQMSIVAVAKKLFDNGDDGSASTAASARQLAQQALLTAASITAMAAITAAGVTSATALGTAWWPVAEAVSLASFGSNAAGAAAGMGTVIALGESASVPKLATGTNYIPYDGLYMLHQGEAVQPKQYNPAVGGVQDGQRGQAGGSHAPQMRVTVEDHTSGAKIQVVQTSDDHIRIVARDVANQAVHANADNAVANAISQPNSKTSKALRLSTTAARAR